MKAVRRYQKVPDISKAQAKRILAPYMEPLVQSIEQAWERWWELPAKAVKAAGGRSRANLVYDFICDEIRTRFENMPGVSVHETRHNMLWLNIEGLLVIRFKKLDNLKLGSNIATRFQTEFTLQMQLPDLPPEAARLVVGYQIDKVQSKITDVLVTYRVGDVVKWFFSARKSGETNVPVPMRLPFPATPTVRKARITAKQPRAAASGKPRITAKKPSAAESVREQVRDAVEAEKAATEDQKESSEQ